IALGVPAGASSPMVPVTVSLGRPDSAEVASSGATPRRVGLVTARMRVLPERWNSSSGPVTPTMPMGTWPLTRSAIAGPVPRYGTWTISKIAQPVSYHADGSCGLRGVTSSAMLAAACSGDIMLTLYSYPELFGVADNNGYGLKVFAFLRLAGVAFRHEHIFDASSPPPPQLPSLPHH